MTNTQAELRERLAARIATMRRAGLNSYDYADLILALLPPAPAVSEALEECKGLLRVMIERDPHETITDSDAGQWKMIDEWRHRARKALAALGEGGA